MYDINNSGLFKAVVLFLSGLFNSRKKEARKVKQHYRLLLTNNENERLKHKWAMQQISQKEQMAQKEIQNLQTRLTAREDSILLRLYRGQCLFNDLIHNASIDLHSTEDKKNLIYFYSVSHRKEYNKWKCIYQNPSKQMILFLILCEENMSEEDISRVLNIKHSTLRSLKSRINNREIKRKVKRIEYLTKRGVTQ